MTTDQQGLSHEEVWDDSALIDSWNEALAEYKKYHSVFVKGGGVHDVLQSQDPPSPKSPPSDPTSKDAQPTETAEQEATAGTAAAPPPQVLLGSIRDENLKRLLMSWYHAGYYTGLFEGQQQQQQQNARAS